VAATTTATAATRTVLKNAGAEVLEKNYFAVLWLWISET